MDTTKIPTRTVESMIESFKDKYPMEINLHSKPSVVSVMNEYTKLKNSGNRSDAADAYLYAYEKYIAENSLEPQTTEYPYMECPFFTEQEVEDFRDYYAKSGEESYADYFGESMTAQLSNSHKSHDGKTWSQRITELQNRLKYSQDYNEIDQIKQNILDLGWNPEIEYNTETQTMATKRYMSIMEDRLPKVHMVDIQPMIEVEALQTHITESADAEIIHPVSIVLIRGKRIISKVISKFTKSDFTHAAIALDGDYTKLYSFSYDNTFNRGGGFSLETVDEYPTNNRLAIYTFFINDEDYKKLEERLQYMLGYIKDTHYSIKNLLLFPFKSIKFEVPDNMICSQFVDSCMKLINIDITGTSPSKVSPAMLHDVSVSNTKIYKTYDGPVKDFNHAKTSRFLKKLSKSAKMIKSESTIESYIENYFCPVVTEVKSIINANKEGDLLITNPFPNFDAEYAASHKLLLQYDKAHNTEAMKYELARLYYMNYILERKLYHNKFVRNKEANMKTRARILNDFNKYLKVVMQAEPNFNFGEYYEASSFYPHTVQVNKSIISVIKTLL